MSMRFVFLLAALFVGHAQAVEYGAVLADKSTLTFQSRQMGVKVQGRFARFDTQLAFDPAKPETAKVEVSVDVASIDAGSKEANDEVVGKPWFSARMFPMAKFVASRVKPLGGGRYEVSGGLTIKGKTLPITAPLMLKMEGNNGVFDGGFTLKRIDFGVGDGPWADDATVANEVVVNFHIVASAVQTGTTAGATKTK
ncbi:MAG: YceI family protein [Betaproteobacteria bacterium]|nr:YceI family protein [Betaproteobacteria bacterium]